jgi:tRNA(Ile)-lysidine synthase
MSFSPQRLAESLLALPPAKRYWIAFSGGLDSTVLLHAISAPEHRLQVPLTAIHIDHGLSPHAAEWSSHCASICEALEIPIELQRVNAQPEKGESPEAAARRARYAAIEGLINADEMLLTAHHQDDQAETLLLQLLRGAGPHGLAAMPVVRPLGSGWLGRPLLHFNRSELLAYARAEGLNWIDDPSNFDTGFERNFLRHELLPLLRERRGEIGAVLARSAEHFAEAAILLDTLAASDLAAIGDGENGSLPVVPLREMDRPRLRNLLRFWLKGRAIALPDSGRLGRIVDEVLCAAEDGQPLVEWPGVEVRRYRNRLYVISPLPVEPESQQVPWSSGDEVVLPDGLGLLEMKKQVGAGIRTTLWEQAEVTVRFRQGGENCIPRGRGQHHALKKLFQEAGVPPWWRSRWPLIYIDDDLAAVPGLFLCDPFAALADETGIDVCWHGADVALQDKKTQNS